MVSVMNEEQALKLLDLSIEDKKQVQQDIYSLILLIAKGQDISIDKNDFPRVTLQPGESSEYDRRRNIINIGKEKIGKGESYTAEIGHFLRDYVTGKVRSSDAVEDLEEAKIQEFYDRATYQIAKTLSRETPLSRLFKEKGLDYSSKQGRKKLADLGRVARKQVKEEEKTENDFSKSNALREIFHFKSHIPYTIADKYSGDEFLQVPEFYSLPNSEVRDRFFRNRGLERVLTSLTIISFFGMLTFFIPSINGNVIQNSLKINSINFFSIFLIVFTISLFFLLKSKKI